MVRLSCLIPFGDAFQCIRSIQAAVVDGSIAKRSLCTISLIGNINGVADSGCGGGYPIMYDSFEPPFTQKLGSSNASKVTYMANEEHKAAIRKIGNKYSLGNPHVCLKYIHGERM